ncbi:MAG: HhH-GPD-type base excision DNA repair protein [Kineosporiaceae bacterium]
MAGQLQLSIVGDAEADAFLAADPFALLVGMLLDQQIPMEKAFAGPALIASRLGVTRLDPAVIAELDEQRLLEIMTGPPAVHRFPGAFATRLHDLCAMLVRDYGGDVTGLWTDVDGATALRRITELPGFGTQKSKIFLALLGKQCGITPQGWQEASAPYSEPGTFRSVADVVDRESLTRVREFKKAAKAAARAGN